MKASPGVLMASLPSEERQACQPARGSKPATVSAAAQKVPFYVVSRTEGDIGLHTRAREEEPQ